MAKADRDQLVLVIEPANGSDLIADMVDSDDGYRAHRESSLDEALDWLRRIRPACIVLDVDVGGTDELGALYAIRGVTDTVPVVLVDGIDDEIALKAVRMGAQDVLVKAALHRADLLRAVTHAVERSKTEQALRASEQAYARAYEKARRDGDHLRARDRVRRDFLATLAHDVRSPLALMISTAATMERSELDLSADQLRAMSGRIVANGTMLDDLVQDLIDVARFGSGLGVVDPTVVDVGELVRRTAQRLAQATDRRVNVDTVSFLLNLDRVMVERAVHNVVSNALKYSPRDTEVSVRARGSDQSAVITVDDHGPGVPDPVKVRIFEPFERAGAEGREAVKGSGIGLYLVKRFTELHDGQAWVEDRPGGGARFYLVFEERAETATASPDDDNSLLGLELSGSSSAREAAELRREILAKIGAAHSNGHHDGNGSGAHRSTNGNGYPRPEPDGTADPDGPAAG